MLQDGRKSGVYCIHAVCQPAAVAIYKSHLNILKRHTVCAGAPLHSLCVFRTPAGADAHICPSKKHKLLLCHSELFLYRHPERNRGSFALEILKKHHFVKDNTAKIPRLTYVFSRNDRWETAERLLCSLCMSLITVWGYL